MKKIIVNYGGTVLLYFIIFIGVILISNKITHINYDSNVINNGIAFYQQ